MIPKKGDGERFCWEEGMDWMLHRVDKNLRDGVRKLPELHWIFRLEHFFYKKKLLLDVLASPPKTKQIIYIKYTTKYNHEE
jgi:hypothetical protein